MRVIIPLLILFIAAQFLGIFVGAILSQDYDQNPYVQELYFQPQGADQSFLSVIFLFLLIIVGTVILLYIIKYYKGKLLFLIIEFFLIAVPSSIVFYSFLRMQFLYFESMVVAIILGSALALLKWKFSYLKNVAAVFASAAVGALFGLSFSPFLVLVFLVILAIYDYIAVFKTKHMVTLAKEVLKRDMALTISSKAKIPKIGMKRIDLGTGDILAPIMLEVSFLPTNPSASILILIGSAISVFLIFYLLRTRKMILPALPPIILGMIISLIIGVVLGIIPL